MLELDVVILGDGAGLREGQSASISAAALLRITLVLLSALVFLERLWHQGLKLRDAGSVRRMR
jgi:hypothetical protein